MLKISSNSSSQMVVCTLDLTCKTVSSAKCLSLEGFFLGGGKSSKGDKRESRCLVSDLKVSVWLNIFSSVSVGQTRNMTPSHEVCIAGTVLQYLYF